MIPIFEPYFSGNEKKYLKDCIDTTWISSQGEYIQKFEKSLFEYHKMNEAIVTSNCTTALHLALKSLNIGIDDEVLCPDLTFIAPANMIALSGAKPVLVDIDPITLTIDPTQIEKSITKNTKAIIVVHQFGHAAHMNEIMEIAKKYNLYIIEDNAESIGAKYKGQLLGTFGDISTYSFFGNKIITTGEGGALLTNNPDIATRARELRDHGMSHKKKYHHIDLGYNYRMTNMQASIGLAQMEKLDHILNTRNKQMNYYNERLCHIEGVSIRDFKSWCDPVHWLITITLDEYFDRDLMIDYMKKNDVDARQMINPVHKAEHFKKFYNSANFPNSILLSESSMHLPSSTHLTLSQIDRIIDIFESGLNKLKNKV
tara:strand:- start:121 stop:1233 length:1113 start_codon:yes stop_codon:yes gene_type:complete